MTPQDLIKITGQHLLFLGIPTYNWSLAQFQQAAQFARAHGVDNLLVKVADGANEWYGGIGNINAIFDTIRSEGVGMIPYIYSYGNEFGALDREIDIMLEYLHDSGIVCMNAEKEWNGQVAWAQHLCGRIQGTGTFLVSTWADPSLQNWQGVIAALAPCTTVFMPQQYNNYLATFWGEFAANGAQWLQPTVNLTQDFGANDPVSIASHAKNQGHTAISVWYYDTAVANPGLLDAIYAAFPKGATPVQQYGPNSSDFASYFTANADGTWTCKLFNTVLLGANLALFSQLSTDGQTLPIIGLPRTNELYQTESDGYQWSVQFFERGLIVYDPAHRHDGQPGMGDSYLGKYAQFQRYDPQAIAVIGLPKQLASEIQTVISDVAAMAKIAAGLPPV
jgi:hypothetical protein